MDGFFTKLRGRRSKRTSTSGPSSTTSLPLSPAVQLPVPSQTNTSTTSIPKLPAAAVSSALPIQLLISPPSQAAQQATQPVASDIPSSHPAESSGPDMQARDPSTLSPPASLSTQISQPSTPGSLTTVSTQQSGDASTIKPVSFNNLVPSADQRRTALQFLSQILKIAKDATAFFPPAQSVIGGVSGTIGLVMVPLTR